MTKYQILLSYSTSQFIFSVFTINLRNKLTLKVEALGIYFERIGVAFQVRKASFNLILIVYPLLFMFTLLIIVVFQIIDDILNLRGLPGKVRAEDIMMGKVLLLN